MKLLVLGARDVHGLLPYGECAAAMRDALVAYASGQVHQPLRTIIRPPAADDALDDLELGAAGAQHLADEVKFAPGRPAFDINVAAKA